MQYRAMINTDSKKKLEIKKDAIRELNEDEAANVVGGADGAGRFGPINTACSTSTVTCTHTCTDDVCQK
jgi:hypothetical protein